MLWQCRSLRLSCNKATQLMLVIIRVRSLPATLAISRNAPNTSTHAVLTHTHIASKNMYRYNKF